MLLIGTLTDIQRGTFWGELVEVFLLGIHTCLIFLTLRKGLWEGRPLRRIGWFVVVIYWLAVGRVVWGFWILYRVMFVNGGNVTKYNATDYVLHGVRRGLSLVSSRLAETLFIWRLYVIWSRDIRILLLPALLFLCSATSAMVVLITEFVRAQDPRYMAINSSAFHTLLGTVFVNTCYVTILVSGRLWWVGRMVDRVDSTEVRRESRYRGAIIALVQSGAIYTIATVLSVITSTTKNTILSTVMLGMGAHVIGISTTLLVLQLDIFQDQMRMHQVNGPPLTTGPTIHFNRPHLTHLLDDQEVGWPSPPFTRPRRRASIAAYYLHPHNHDTDKDVSCLPRPNPHHTSSSKRLQLNIGILGHA